MVHVIYAHEEAPDNYSKSIFLVGPTPRDENTPSWRPDMIAALEEAGYDGVIFSPEPRGEFNSTYDGQVAWEKKHLEMADLILAWVPRQSPSMPAFTTNVEFGKYVGSNKLLYGRPSWAEKVRYLDWMYMDVHGSWFGPALCRYEIDSQGSGGATGSRGTTQGRGPACAAPYLAQPSVSKLVC